MRALREKVNESLSSVLPITAIVLVLSITAAPLLPGALILFLFGAVLLVAGMGLFTLGVDISMLPMGEGVGVELAKHKRLLLPLLVCFVVGVVVTIAEPDLQVLAHQLPSIPNMTLILAVAVGVGVAMMAALLRIRFQFPLSRLLLVCYAVVFVLACFTPGNFLPLAFDSGGVTTGPITVPFIMALGIGMASMRNDKNSGSDSFGFVSLSSVGPIIAVMLLGVFFKPADSAYTMADIGDIQTTQDAAREFLAALPAYAEEVLVAVLPIVGVFVVFQLLTRRFKAHQLGRMAIGLVYAYVGLVLFLTGVNVGFMPAGQMIGSALAGGFAPWLLVLVGMVVGFFIVRAEPAVQVLARQVEENTNGSVTQRALNLALSIGMAVSVGLAMLRILTGLPILYILVPGYTVALVMTFFVPQLFTGIAFDSGGVASGPMTTTFLLPLAMGACEAVGGDVLTDAFGIVALVAMTPLCTIQLLGLYGKWKVRREAESRRLALQKALEGLESGVVYWEV